MPGCYSVSQEQDEIGRDVVMAVNVRVEMRDGSHEEFKGVREAAKEVVGFYSIRVADANQTIRIPVEYINRVVEEW